MKDQLKAIREYIENSYGDETARADAIVLLDNLTQAAQFKERQDVIAFHQKFGVPVAPAASFLNPEAYGFRVKFMQEELDEFQEAHSTGDMHGAADALVDLAYVVHGTAHMMGLPWPMLWMEVQRANISKVRATDASQSKRGTALDVIKPAGWVAPDHTPALGTGPWPTLGEQA